LLFALCVDDAVLFFNSNGDLKKGSSRLRGYLLKFEVTMNIGTGVTPSKTEAMYFPPPRRLYSDADTSRLDVLDYLGNLVGFIDFTTEIQIPWFNRPSFSNLRCRR
jgi:hypothetical protein